MFKKVLAACVYVAAVAPALAQDAYPSRPIKVIVPFASGSSTDALARVIGDRLSRSLGQPFVVENRPGAGGVIGTAAGAKVPPDGYTLTMAGSGPFGINPAIYTKLPYDPLKDFTAVVGIASTPQVLVTSATGPYTSLKQLQESSKAPGKSIDYASIGIGSTSHLTGQYFQRLANVPLTHVPFKGNADAQMQVVGGTVPLMFDAMPGVLSSIKSGRLRALAVASKTRSPFAPDIPTFREQGLPLEVTGWIGLVAPAGTPQAVVDRLNKEINVVLGQPEFIEKLNALAFTAMGGSRADFQAFITSEIATWSKVAKEANIQMEGEAPR
jgi:tripartite-type tricarboxylate transporter receptor subunit TctC